MKYFFKYIKNRYDIRYNYLYTNRIKLNIY